MVLALLDRRAERVQLRELAAVLVRQEQAHRLEAVGEMLRDALAQRVEALAGQRGDLQRVGEAVREAAGGAAGRPRRSC